MTNRKLLIITSLVVFLASIIIIAVAFQIKHLTQKNTAVKPTASVSTKVRSEMNGSTNKAKKIAQLRCKKRDYGGCDNEKNVYKWKDDGLRKHKIKKS